MHVRRIRPDDADALRDIRLRALREDPGAFESSLESEVDRPSEMWAVWAAAASTGNDQAAFLAEIDGAVVGLAGAFREDDKPRDLHLISMWVAPEARRRGLGLALTESVARWASTADADRLTLWVVEGNHAAADLYRRAGFEPTGATKPLLKSPNVTEHEMAMQIGVGSKVPPGMVEFQPMSSEEFDTYLAAAVPALAADLMESEGLALQEASSRAMAEIAGLLPDAEATRGHHLCSLRAGSEDYPVGWIWFGRRRIDGRDVCYLYDISVFEHYRGNGLGSAALDELEEWTTAQGLDGVVLHVFEHNTRARRLYENLGFVVSNASPGHVVMTKHLRTA